MEVPKLETSNSNTNCPNTYATNSNPEVQMKNSSLIDDLQMGLMLSSKESELHDGSTHQHDGPDSSEHRVFSCNYCTRKFYSSQALGGHQNAQKRERNLARSHGMAMVHGYSSMASLPLHGSFGVRSLGIQTHSMIHKPNYGSSYRIGGAVTPQFGSNNRKAQQRPSIGRLVAEAGPTLGGGAARFDGGRRLSPVVDGISLNGSSSSGFKWVGSTSHLKKNSNAHQEELTNLDLSLKL